MGKTEVCTHCGSWLCPKCGTHYNIGKDEPCDVCGACSSCCKCGDSDEYCPSDHNRCSRCNSLLHDNDPLWFKGAYGFCAKCIDEVSGGKGEGGISYCSYCDRIFPKGSEEYDEARGMCRECSRERRRNIRECSKCEKEFNMHDPEWTSGRMGFCRTCAQELGLLTATVNVTVKDNDVKMIVASDSKDLKPGDVFISRDSKPKIH